jgi:hypothetical protein
MIAFHTINIAICHRVREYKKSAPDTGYRIKYLRRDRMVTNIVT